MKKAVVMLLSVWTVGVGMAGVTQAQGECFPTCRTGFVCNPANECVSICNPPCGDGQLCTAEASCIADPAAQPLPPQQPYAQQPPATQAQPQRWEQAPPQQQPAQRAWQDAPPIEPSTSPEGESVESSFRLSVGFHLGVAGSAASFLNGNDSGSTSLDPTFGVQMQGLAPLGSYLLVGAGIGYRSMLLEGARNRNSIVGIDAAVGVHSVIDLGGVSIDPFALVTIGLGVLLVSGDDAVYGLDFGVRFGANLWFSSTVGAYASLGYQRGDYFDSAGTRFGSNRLRVTTQQAAIELGMAFQF